MKGSGTRATEGFESSFIPLLKDGGALALPRYEPVAKVVVVPGNSNTSVTIGLGLDAFLWGPDSPLLYVAARALRQRLFFGLSLFAGLFSMILPAFVFWFTVSFFFAGLVLSCPPPPNKLLPRTLVV